MLIADVLYYCSELKLGMQLEKNIQIIRKVTQCDVNDLDKGRALSQQLQVRIRQKPAASL